MEPVARRTPQFAATLDDGFAGVALDGSGNLYGTTGFGGTSNSGTVYALDPAYSVLHSFAFAEQRLQLEASADLGATRMQSFWRVVFPLSLPGTIGGGMLVFILTAGSYVTPKLLGGPSSIMFGEIIVDQFGGTFDWAFGAALSVAFILVIAGLVLVVGRFVGLRRVFLGQGA